MYRPCIGIRARFGINLVGGCDLSDKAVHEEVRSLRISIVWHAAGTRPEPNRHLTDDRTRADLERADQ